MLQQVVYSYHCTLGFEQKPAGRSAMNFLWKIFTEMWDYSHEENKFLLKMQVISIYLFTEKSDWGTLVPTINLKNVIKLGFVLE
jgi:hypothetical protein